MQRFISVGIREQHSQVVNLSGIDHTTDVPFCFRLLR